jgi:hypothetical protein
MVKESNNMKILHANKTIFEINKEKYDLILQILQEIGKIINKQILIISDFKNINEQILEENSEKIFNILLNYRQKIYELTDVQLPFKTKNSHKRNISNLRRLAKFINFKITIHKQKIFINNLIN